MAEARFFGLLGIPIVFWLALITLCQLFYPDPRSMILADPPSGIAGTGPNSWFDSTRAVTIRAMSSSAIPMNYLNDDSTWTCIDVDWEIHNDTIWKVVKGKHRTYAMENGWTYYVVPRGGIRHAIGTRTSSLIKFNLSDSSYDLLSSASYDSMTVDRSVITHWNIFPGVHKRLQYFNTWYREQFVFTQEARDSLAGQGPWANRMLATVTRLDVDSLNLDIYDSLGQVSWSSIGRMTDTWLKFRDGDSVVFTLPSSYVRGIDTIGDSTLTGPRVHKRLVLIGGQPFLVEMFNPVPIAQWPDGPVEHSALFGNNVIEASALWHYDSPYGFIGTPSSSGTLDSIRGYCDGWFGYTSYQKFGLYIHRPDSSCELPAFVDSCAEVTTISPAWYSGAAYLNGTITSGQSYVIVVWGDNRDTSLPRIYYQSNPGTNDTTYSWAEIYGAWPASVCDAGRDPDEQFSLVAYYTEAAAGRGRAQIITINQD